MRGDLDDVISPIARVSEEEVFPYRPRLRASRGPVIARLQWRPAASTLIRLNPENAEAPRGRGFGDIRGSRGDRT